MGGKRLAEFDVLKGIGILLVVLGHTTISDPMKYMIYCFHMPLFVAVSGYFFHPKAIGALCACADRNAPIVEHSATA